MFNDIYVLSTESITDNTLTLDRCGLTDRHSQDWNGGAGNGLGTLYAFVKDWTNRSFFKSQEFLQISKASDWYFMVFLCISCDQQEARCADVDDSA